MHLLEEGANVRLVKGAYRESEENAFQSADKINSNFSKLMRMLFENSNSNTTFAIATHDSKLIEEAIELSKNSMILRSISNFKYYWVFVIR